ncbi:MAG: hypothetical protein HPY65_08050 [Syntrophaceae bacterium]|nr:hypothetical protein [Syntrophaceae bacterium]
MATKEDILEQLIEEYLIHKGYFVRHNIKYLPRKDHPDFVSNQDSNHSDIDILAINPLLEGSNRVYAVSCKSWQSGFNPTFELNCIRNQRTVRGREAWRGFRELVIPKWSEAFIKVIQDNTGMKKFTYILAVAKINGDRSVWENDQEFRRALEGNPIRILTFKEVIEDILPNLRQTVAATEVGRILQMFKVSGVQMEGNQ